MLESSVSLVNVYKKVSENFSLMNINLSLQRGEIHFLAGENASGKTCLLRLISGFLTADSGSLIISPDQDGKPLLIASSFQDFSPFPDLSLAENIFFHKLPYKAYGQLFRVIDYNLLNRRCAELIEEFRLPFHIEDPVSQLGLAQQQLISLLRIYILGAPIILLDEPTALFTDFESGIVFDLLKKLRARNCTILIVSSNLSEIAHYGQRISVIKEGRIVSTENVADLSRTDIMLMLSSAAYTNRYPKLSVAQGKSLFKVENLSAGGILHDVSIHLHKGEILGITGLVGSGRTLLCRCLSGSASCRYDYMEIDGVRVKISTPAQAIENGIAMMPEDAMESAIFSNLDIGDNLSFLSLSRFLSSPVTIDKTYQSHIVETYLKKLNIPFISHSSIEACSPGLLQKISLTKWVMSGSRIYILDEPTRGLDVPSRIDIYNILSDLCRKDAGILLISSNMEELLGICDRVMLISKGQIALDLPHGKATKEMLLECAMN